jgi:hypothetical protein
MEDGGGAATTGPMLHDFWARTIARKSKPGQSPPGIFLFVFCNAGEKMQLSSLHLQSKHQTPVNVVW